MKTILISLLLFFSVFVQAQVFEVDYIDIYPNSVVPGNTIMENYNQVTNINDSIFVFTNTLIWEYNTVITISNFWEVGNTVYFDGIMHNIPIGIELIRINKFTYLFKSDCFLLVLTQTPYANINP